MSTKVRVLYFVDRMLRGGIQTFVLEVLKHIDKEKIQIDFLLLDDGKKYELEDTLKELGANVYKLNGIWIRKPIDYIKYFKAVDEFFKYHNDYKVVHLHSSSKNFYILKSAKKYGIPVRIAHSHCIGFQTTNKLQIMIGNICKPLLKKYATDYFACSELAGKWLFGEKTVKSGKVKIIHNAIDCDKFKYDERKRKTIRKQLNIKDNELVIGHVGRFTVQKNHKFLVEIFKEITKLKIDSKLVLIGTGQEEEKIKSYVKKINIDDKVIFVGFRENVNDYMSAMDVFVLPSLCEGLGIVLIEAQANGMKCFASKDVVPIEARVSELLSYISLENKAEEWAKVILNTDIKRTNKISDIEKNGYDISYIGFELGEFYKRR